MARCGKCKPAVGLEDCADEPCRRAAIRRHFDRAVSAKWRAIDENPPASKPADTGAWRSYATFDERTAWMIAGKLAECEGSIVQLERRFLSRHERHNGKALAAFLRDVLDIEVTPPSPQHVRLAAVQSELSAYRRWAATAMRVASEHGVELIELIGPVAYYHDTSVTDAPEPVAAEQPQPATATTETEPAGQTVVQRRLW